MKTISFILLLAACNEGHTAPASQQPSKAIAVDVATVERRDVALCTEAVGSLDGFINVDIRARVRGYLLVQAYEDGATVEAGAKLFSIEPAEHSSTGEIASASLARARVTLEKSQLDLDRAQGLRRAGVISRQDLDDASAAVRDADAAARAAKAERTRASLDLRYTTVRSPIDGVAGLAQVRPGNLVGADGPTLLTTVSQIDPMRVRFPIGEVDYVAHPEWFARSGNANIELVRADGTSYPHRGSIVAVDRHIDPATGTLQALALVRNPDRALKPGEYVRVRIQREGDGKDVVVVPESALVAVQGRFAVAVVAVDRKVSMKPLELGPTVEGGMRVVRGGLAGGEQIVIGGLMRVRDGVVVEPRPAEQNQER